MVEWFINHGADLNARCAWDLTPISYAAPAYYADKLCDSVRMYLLPLLKRRLIDPPITEAMMLSGLANPGPATKDDKNAQALANIKAGRIGPSGPSSYTWPSAGPQSGNPQHDDIADKIFYI